MNKEEFEEIKKLIQVVIISFLIGAGVTILWLWNKIVAGILIGAFFLGLKIIEDKFEVEE